MGENKIRIRARTSFFYAEENRRIMPNDVVKIPESEARIWIRHGMAVEDKSLDEAPEKKDEDHNPMDNKKNLKSRKR